MSLDGPLSQAEVMTEKARVKTSLSDLEKVTEGEKERGQERPGGPWRGEDAQEIPSQLNVIGLTVDDALPQRPGIDRHGTARLEKVLRLDPREPHGILRPLPDLRGGEEFSVHGDIDVDRHDYLRLRR